jgi:hypothetical protein
MDNDKIELSVPVTLLVPKVPNFILFDGIKDRNVDVAELTDAQLTKLGKMWTDRLVAHAQSRRTTPKLDRKELPEA